MPPKKGTVKSKDKAEFNCGDGIRHTGEFPLTKRDCPIKLSDGTKLYTFKFPCKPCAGEKYFEEMGNLEEDYYIRETIAAIDKATARGDWERHEKLLRDKARLEEKRESRLKGIKQWYKNHWNIVIPEAQDQTGFRQLRVVEED